MMVLVVFFVNVSLIGNIGYLVFYNFLIWIGDVVGSLFSFDVKIGLFM